ncbi:hypothetical protein KX729_09245 [Rhizobium sp. XQZ8]|uniref:hypothetical protein n=1 Tax=Rhizobium populisoli TaxID=2859785 RepID=UPI001CA508BB|nr:hypothetical protein [Rhizobium populisoli]MBW6421624.1 hypothetical protein [Rhizobium populisoli]
MISLHKYYIPHLIVKPAASLRKIIPPKPQDHFLAITNMSNCEDYPDAVEPKTVSEEYLANLIEYRRRLTRLYEQLTVLNGMIEENQAAIDPASQIRH